MDGLFILEQKIHKKMQCKNEFLRIILNVQNLQ